MRAWFLVVLVGACGNTAAEAFYNRVQASSKWQVSFDTAQSGCPMFETTMACVDPFGPGCTGELTFQLEDDDFGPSYVDYWFRKYVDSDFVSCGGSTTEDVGSLSGTCEWQHGCNYELSMVEID
jgi:hypothetical protein